MSDHNQMRQCLLVFIPMVIDDIDNFSPPAWIIDLERRLEEALGAARVGEFDGDEFGEGWARLFMYGPDADGMLATILPILEDAILPQLHFLTSPYDPCPPNRPAGEIRIE